MRQLKMAFCIAISMVGPRPSPLITFWHSLSVALAGAALESRTAVKSVVAPILVTDWIIGLCLLEMGRLMILR